MHLVKHSKRAAIAGFVLAIAIFGILPAAAKAHVTVGPGEIPASGHGHLDFSVPHGCDGSPTTAVTVQLPPEVTSATPEVVAGWEIEVNEGEQTEVTWRGGPLADDHLQVFGMSVGIDGEAGQDLAIPVVQDCIDGEAPWIEVASEGGPEPEMPAPTVTLVSAEEDGSAGDAGGAASAEAADSDSDDETETAVKIVTLVFSIVAMVLAIIAIVLAALAFSRVKQAVREEGQ